MLIHLQLTQLLAY